MITTKYFTKRLDIKDVNLLYKPKEDSCLKILTDIYRGRCLDGAYIIDIDSIVKISNVDISQDHPDARGLVCVMFKAQIILQGVDDLIAQCKIIRRKEDRLFAETKYSNIILPPHDLLKVVKPGDSIPVIIKKSRYTLLRNKISVFAVPYTPSAPIKNYIYVLENSI